MWKLSVYQFQEEQFPNFLFKTQSQLFAYIDEKQFQHYSIQYVRIENIND